MAKKKVGDPTRNMMRCKSCDTAAGGNTRSCEKCGKSVFIKSDGSEVDASRYSERGTAAVGRAKKLASRAAGKIEVTEKQVKLVLDFLEMANETGKEKISDLMPMAMSATELIEALENKSTTLEAEKEKRRWVGVIEKAEAPQSLLNMIRKRIK